VNFRSFALTYVCLYGPQVMTVVW